MKMGTQQTDGSRQMMTIRHRPQRFVRLVDKGDEGSPQWAGERTVVTQKGVQTRIKALVIKIGAYWSETMLAMKGVGNTHQEGWTMQVAIAL